MEIICRADQDTVLGDRPLRLKRRTCCSSMCLSEWLAAGKGPSLVEVTARPAHVTEMPKGCRTMGEYLAAGGVIYVELAPPG